jgi:hypothetical protein
VTGQLTDEWGHAPAPASPTSIGGCMDRSIIVLVLTVRLAAGFLTVPEALAQGSPPGTVTVSSAVSGIHQFAGELEQGGDVQWSSALLSGSVTRQFVPAFAAGLGLRCDFQDWRFGSPSAFNGKAPWQRLQRPGASLNLSLALSHTLVVGASPLVEWAYDSRANTADALIYGAVLSAAKVFSPRFTLGAGASISRQFYSVKSTPFIIVNWKITDRLRLANAVPAGPLGGAGVELRYAPTTDWELAGGGVWRSDRWRLESDGPAAGRVGETSFIPLLARLSRKLGPKTRLDLYAGALTNSRLTVKDSDGHEIAHDDYGVVPTFTATLSGKF